MAIVNRTPDSFFDRGATFAEDAALRAVGTAVADGADIIDIGGGKAGAGGTPRATQGIPPPGSPIHPRPPPLPPGVLSIHTPPAQGARAAGAPRGRPLY